MEKLCSLSQRRYFAAADATVNDVKRILFQKED